MLQLMNQEKIKKESDCYLYCIDNAFDLVEKKQFGKAAAYYENAARSLRELEKLNTDENTLFKFLYEIDSSGKEEINKWMNVVRKTL